MSNAEIRGHFVWHELMTSDTDGAIDFYSNVVPWKTQDSGMPGYTLWVSGKHRVAGLMALPEDDASGTPPHWLVYIGTPDVDATVTDAQRLGGTVLKEAADIPHVGRFAVLSDPQGATFAVFTPLPRADDDAAGDGGTFPWHELATTDLDAALEFYTELFGWSKGAAHDMGEEMGGTYQLFSLDGKEVGGIYKVRDNSTPPNWLSYAHVADTDKAAEAVKSNGGRVLNGPMEVPGGSWIVMLLDPQGGAFAVVEPPKPAAAAPKPSAGKKAAKAAPAEAPAAPAKKSAAKKAPAKKSAVQKRAVRKVVKKAAKKAARKAPAKGAAKKAVKKALKKTPAKKVAKRGVAKSTAKGVTAPKKGVAKAKRKK